MKKRMGYMSLVLAVAVLSSCAAGRQQTAATRPTKALIYANSWQLQSYPQVHERPPIN